MADLIVGTASQHLYSVHRGVPQKKWGAPSPSYVLKTGPHVYAVSETGYGEVVLLSEEAPSPIASISSGGDSPCHLALHPSGRWLYVANYMDGVASALELAPDGTFTGTRVDLPHSGHGPHTERQEGPHAHFCAVSPGGGFLIVVDLGTDELRAYPLDAAGRPNPAPHLSAMPAGSGPRHLAWIDHGAGMLIAGELDGRMYHATWDETAGRATVVGSVVASEGNLRQLSHIDVVDGFALVGVRGANTVGVFAPNSSTPEPVWERIAEIPTTAWPRHLAVVEWNGPDVGTSRALVVAGERAGLLGIHPWDPQAVQPVGPLTAVVPVPVPQCVVPVESAAK